ERTAHALRQDAREGIVRAASRERHHNRDRARGINLRRSWRNRGTEQSKRGNADQSLHYRTPSIIALSSATDNDLILRCERSEPPQVGHGRLAHSISDLG